jgi:hypothetical protein
LPFHHKGLALNLRLVVPVGLALSLTGGVALSNSEPALTAVRNALADPLSVFAARSPGQRGAGALFQSKANKRRAQRGPILAHSPSERVLPGERVRSSPTLPFINEVPTAFAFPANAISPDLFVPASDIAPAPPLAEASFPPGLIFAPAAGGGGATIPGVGTEIPSNPGAPVNPGSATPGGGSTPSEPPPIGEVPEPATWCTMIIGFFAVGFAMRLAPAGSGGLSKRTRAGAGPD